MIHIKVAQSVPQLTGSFFSTSLMSAVKSDEGFSSTHDAGVGPVMTMSYWSSERVMVLVITTDCRVGGREGRKRNGKGE